MAVGVPVATRLACPRCKFPSGFVNVDGGTLFRCSRCEWMFTLATQAPTGTATNALAQGGTAITVASGGTSFTNGMTLLFDTGTSAEPLTVNGASSATNIPVTAAGKAHAASATFGQLLITPTLSGVGQTGVPPAPPYGF